MAADDVPASWWVGGSVGLPGYASRWDPQLFTVGVQATRVRRGHLGPDIAVGTMPRVLASGLFGLGARAGVTFPIGQSQTMLLPTAGVSVIAGMERRGGAIVTRGYAGVAAAFFGSSSSGLRVGATWYVFQDLEDTAWLLELGWTTRR